MDDPAGCDVDAVDAPGGRLRDPDLAVADGKPERTREPAEGCKHLLSTHVDSLERSRLLVRDPHAATAHRDRTQPGTRSDHGHRRRTRRIEAHNLAVKAADCPDRAISDREISRGCPRPVRRSRPRRDRYPLD